MTYQSTFWSSLLLGTAMIAIAGCQPDSLSRTPTTSPSPATARESTNSTISGNRPNSNPNTVPVTIYQADSQCQDFVSQKIYVSKNQPLESAIDQVLKQTNNGDFEISGYRVNVNSQTRVATIDLRLPANGSRNFASLSSCEQFALFGSLRRTVMDNQVWQVRDVKFTHQGQEILF